MLRSQSSGSATTIAKQAVSRAVALATTPSASSAVGALAVRSSTSNDKYTPATAHPEKDAWSVHVCFVLLHPEKGAWSVHVCFVLLHPEMDAWSVHVCFVLLHPEKDAWSIYVCCVLVLYLDACV